MQEAEDLLANQEYQISSLQVFKLVSESGCSAYDREFFALAEQLKISLVTQDKKILLNFPQVAHSLESFLQSEV